MGEILGLGVAVAVLVIMYGGIKNKEVWKLFAIAVIVLFLLGILFGDFLNGNGVGGDIDGGYNTP